MIRHLSWLWGGNIVSALLGIISGALIARILSSEAMGRMGLLLAVCTFFNSVFLAWVQAPLIKYGKESFEKSGGILAVWIKRLPLLLVSLMFIVLFTIPSVASKWSSYIGMGWSWWMSALVIFGVLTLWSQAEIITLAQIQERFSVISKMSVFKQLLCAIAFAAILWGGYGAGAQSALFITFLAGALASLLSARTLFYNRREKAVSKTVDVNTCSRWEMAMHGIPLTGAMLAGYLSYYGDHWLINARLTVGDVGQFFVAYQVFLLISGLTSPFCSVLLPRLISEEASGKADAGKNIQKVFPAANIIWLMFVIFVSAVMPEIYTIVYSSRYLPALIPLMVLLSGTVFCLLSSTYSPYFNVQSRLSRSAWIGVFMTAVNLLFSWFLLPIIGILGSAIGTSISYVVGGLFYVMDQQRHYNVKEYGQITIGMVAMALILLNIPLLDHQVVRYGLCLTAIGLLLIVARRLKYFDFIDFDGLTVRYPSCGRWLKTIFIPVEV